MLLSNAGPGCASVSPFPWLPDVRTELAAFSSRNIAACIHSRKQDKVTMKTFIQ